MSVNSSICRTCLAKTGEMFEIFDELTEFKSKISDLLQIFGDVVIDKDDLFPKLICEECINELFLSAKFRRKCKDAQTSFMSMLTATDETEAIYQEIEYHEDEDKNEISETEFDENILVHPGEDKESYEGYIEIEDEEQKEEGSIDFVFLTSEENDSENNIAYEEDLVPESNEENGVEYLYSQSANTISEEDISGSKFLKTSPNVFNFQCDNCGAKFTQMKNLKKHLMSVHSIVETFSCTVCSKSFVSYDEYIAHKVIHTEESNKISASTSGNDNDEKFLSDDAMPTNSMKKKSHICNQCHKPFISKSALEAHYRTHTGERPFGCRTCKKSFTTQGGLELHERRHNGIKPFVCPICSKRFVESSNLKVHLRSAHTTEKPHQCTYCGRGFSRVFLLQIHLRTHTGEKPFNCNICHKSFAQQGDLSAHKKIHTGERPHRCDICWKGFIKSSGLTLHMKTHTNEVNKPKTTSKKGMVSKTNR